MRAHRRKFAQFRQLTCLQWGALAVAALVMLCGAALCAWVMFGPKLVQTLFNPGGLVIGEAAPNFELTTLTGDKTRLSDFQGLPIVLSFGTTECPSCGQAATWLEAVHTQLASLPVLFIDLQEGQTTVTAFAQTNNLAYPIALELDGAIAAAYHVQALPTIFFIDSAGIIRAKIVERLTATEFTNGLKAIGIGAGQ